jgi:hypothetical protein
MCPVPNMAVLLKSHNFVLSVLLLRYCLSDFEMVSAALITSGITVVVLLILLLLLLLLPLLS